MTYTMTGFERTFSLSVPVERAWKAFTDPEDLEVGFTTRFDADTEEQTAVAESPGGQVGFAVTELVENERLGYRQWAADPSSFHRTRLSADRCGGWNRPDKPIANGC